MRMTFGLRNAAQTFQRYMTNSVMQGLETQFKGTEVDPSFCFWYIDDVIVASETPEMHRLHLKAIFERLDRFGITINLGKCCFGKEKIDFLGYEVTSEGIRPLPEKVQAIIDFPKPRTVEQLRRFLGMVNFYRASLPKAANDQAELNKYLKNARKKDRTIIQWSQEADAAFAKCKSNLQNATMLCYPVKNAELAIMADASNNCVGGVLQIKVGSHWRSLGYFSKKFNDVQLKYSTYDRELLAVYLSVQHFRYMVEGRPFVIYTDHKPLVYAFSKKPSDKETPRRIRQLMFISEFTTDIRHINGSDNIPADTLSRVDAILCPTALDFAELAVAQRTDDEWTKLLSQSNERLQFKQIVLPDCKKEVTCEVSTEAIRPYLPVGFREKAFHAVHDLSHPGNRPTRKLVAAKYFWPNIYLFIRLANSYVHYNIFEIQKLQKNTFVSVITTYWLTQHAQKNG